MPCALRRGDSTQRIEDEVKHMIDRSTQQTATDVATMTPNLRDPMVRAQPFVSLALEFALRDRTTTPTGTTEIESAHIESVLAD